MDIEVGSFPAPVHTMSWQQNHIAPDTLRPTSPLPVRVGASISRKSLRDKIQKDYKAGLYGENDEDKFQELYENDVATVLIQSANPSEKTIIHYLLQKLEDAEFDEPYIRLLVKLSLQLMSKRFTKDDILGGTFPVLHNVLSFGREYRLDNFARLICASGYSNIVQGAIAAPNEMGETALHIAINGQPLREDMRDSPPVAINICVMDMIMEHANDRAFMSRRTHDGNTPLHDLAHYRHCCVRPRECVLNGCKKCRSSASSTIKSFMQTLERLITKYPSALHTPNKAGKTPYVIHLETRQLACEGKLVGIPKRTWVRSNWDNLEYETEPPTDLPTPLPLPDTTFQSKQNDAMDNKSTETHDDEPDEASCRVTTDKKSSKSRYYAKIPVKATDIRNFERRHQSELTTNAGVLFPSRTPHKLKPDGSEEPYQSSDWTLENERQIAIVVSRLLLEGCFSLGNYDKSKTSLFGESQKLPNKQIGFIPQEALNPKTMACHKFLPLHSVLTKVEVHLSNDQPLKVIQASTVSRSKIIRDYNETYLKDVMKWLRETKKVRRILKLVVRDNQRWQCRDETITDIIRGWDIRYLDWNKSDMAIDTIQKAGAKKIVELCLTSSGSNTALIGWSDPDYGLGMFPNLKMIKIRMNPDFESANSRSDYEKKFRDIAKRRFKNLDVEISTQGFMRGGHEGESGVNTGDSDWHGPNRWMKAVREFSSVMSRVQNHNYDEQLKDRLENNRIKVALIDDGVNPQNLGQTRCLEHGEGWPSDDEPYYRSSENHGTVMAKLILELCPYVDIYVAKLNKSAEHNPKYKNSVAEMASQAVEWAIEKDVDIISMSWTIKKTGDNEGERNLVQQIEAAGKTGSDIILFCAAEDEGEYGRGTSLPATCGSKAIKRVGSANQEGKASDSVKEDHVDFLFPGENILQELTDGLKEDKRKGSSASTALASGLAALILWCAVVAGRDKRYYRCEGRLLKLFERLQSAPQKFVDVTKILKTQQNLQEPIKTIEDLMDAVDSSINDPWQKNV